MGVHDIDSELRRVSSFNILGMEKGDLNSVARKGSYVKSSCMDVWCAVANKYLSKKGRRDVLILTMPTSQAIFYDFGSGSGDLKDLAKKWARWKAPSLRHLLIPVNLRNEHWCLLVVELEKKSVLCWDSCLRYDGGETVEGKKGVLFRFLEEFTGDREHWKLQVVFEGIPQQTDSDCGIFCIEFMRAFLAGCRADKELEDQVSQTTMRSARKHILREIQEKEFLEKKQPDIVAGKRQRKKKKIFGDSEV